MDIGTWGRWCFWGLWLFGLGFSFLGGGKRSFCGTFHRLSTRLHRSDIQLRPQWREVIHPQFRISVFPIFAEAQQLQCSSGQASVAPALCSQPFAAGEFGPAADSAAGPKNSIKYRGAAGGRQVLGHLHLSLPIGYGSRQLTPNSQYLSLGPRI